MDTYNIGTEFGGFIVLVFEPKKDRRFEITLYRFLQKATKYQLLSAKRRLMADYFNPDLPFEWKKGIRSTLLVSNAAELDDAIYAVNTMLKSGNRVILCLNIPTSPDLKKIINKYGHLKVKTFAKLFPKISRKYVLTKSFVMRILNSPPNKLLINIFKPTKPKNIKKIKAKKEVSKMLKLKKIENVTWRIRHGFIQVYYPERAKMWQLKIYKDGKLINKFPLMWGRTGWLDALNLLYLKDLAKEYGSGRYCVAIRKHTGEETTVYCITIRVKGVPRKTVRYIPVIRRRPIIVHRRKPARLTTRSKFAYLYLFKDGKPIKKARIDPRFLKSLIARYKKPKVISALKAYYRSKYGPGTYTVVLSYGRTRMTLARFTVEGRRVRSRPKPTHRIRPVTLTKTVRHIPIIRRKEIREKEKKVESAKPTTLLTVATPSPITLRKVEKEYVLVPVPMTQTTIGIKRNYLPWIALGAGALILLLIFLLLRRREEV